MHLCAWEHVCERGWCLLCESTIVRCDWNMWLRLWWRLGAHVHGQLYWEALRLPTASYILQPLQNEVWGYWSSWRRVGFAIAVNVLCWKRSRWSAYRDWRGRSGTGNIWLQRRSTQTSAQKCICNVQRAPYAGVEWPALYGERWKAEWLTGGNQGSVRNTNASAVFSEALLRVMKVLEVTCLQTPTSLRTVDDEKRNPVPGDVKSSPWPTSDSGCCCHRAVRLLEVSQLACSSYLKSDLS